MKIRLNYVSNSSSSSFCLLGVVIKDDANFDADAVFNYLDTNKKVPLILEYGMEVYPESYVLGAGITDMRDDETLGQFRNRTLKALKQTNKDLRLGLNLNKDSVLWRVDGGFR